MALKLQIIVAITFVVTIFSIEKSNAHHVCTLDEMKLLAAEACEHLFQMQQNDVIEHSQHKRDVSNSLDNEVDDINTIHNNDEDIHRYTKVRIHRRDYPKGGYLLINHRHAKVLHRSRHDPEYRIMPLKSYQKELLQKHEESQEEQGVRGKRENSESDQYINVPYCCVNKCRMDFFCRS